MNPLIGTSQNLSRFYAATEIAVELCPADHQCLWEEWDRNHRNIQWIENGLCITEHYGMSTRDVPLLAKMTFLRVHHCVLMLLQPEGRYVDYSKLEKQAKIWLGNGARDALTNASNFHNNAIWQAMEEPPRAYDETSFPYGARYAVLLDGDYHLSQFIPYAAVSFAQNQVNWTQLPQVDIREYQLVERELEGGKPMYATQRAHLIHGYIVSFFYNSGNYGDREALLEKAREWYPHAARIVRNEELPNLFALLENNPSRPSAYANLIEELEAQPVPTFDFAPFGNAIPDQVVSVQLLLQEIALTLFYQKKNPDYQSPQKLFCDRYIEPRLTLLRKVIFPSMKNRMNESSQRLFIAKMGDFTAIAYQMAGRIKITLNQKDVDGSISLMGSDDVLTEGDMGIDTYNGNLRHLCKVIDAVSQQWNIEKFHPYHTVLDL